MQQEPLPLFICLFFSHVQWLKFDDDVVSTVSEFEVGPMIFVCLCFDLLSYLLSKKTDFYDYV